MTRWWFQIFYPYLGKWSQIWRAYFSDGVEINHQLVGEFIFRLFGSLQNDRFRPWWKPATVVGTPRTWTFRRLYSAYKYMRFQGVPPSRPRYKWVYFISPPIFSALIFLAIYRDYNIYNWWPGSKVGTSLPTHTDCQRGVSPPCGWEGASFLRECKVGTS